jgi:hypothetical protein
MNTTPYASSRLARFIDQRIGELSGKTQSEIAREAGFESVNFLTMLKTGAAKLAIDRVPALAKALEADTAHVLRLAFEQTYGGKTMRMIATTLGQAVTDNELIWLWAIRDFSNHTDPYLSAHARSVLHEVIKSEMR